MAVITISRTYGLYSENLLADIAKKHGYGVFCDEIFKKVAQNLDLDFEDAKALYAVENFSTFKIFMHELLGSLREGSMYMGTASQIDAPEFFPLSYASLVDKGNFKKEKSKSYIDMMKKVIYDISKNDNVFIIGRAGQVVLQDQKNAIHLRLEGSFEKSVERVMKNSELSQKEAEAKIKKINKNRADYINYYYGKDCYDGKLYNFVVNVDKISKKGFEDFIEFLMKKN